MSPIQKTVSALDKFLSVLGIKLLIIILASIFLCIGKLNQDSWILAVLTIAGFRTFNQAVGIVKGTPVKGKEMPSGNE